jgi:hypothetical protein
MNCHDAEYLDLEEIVLRKIHTEASLRNMHGKIASLQKALVESWVEVTGSGEPNLKTMKWFALNKFVTEPMRCACASITNTGPLERTHKSWKDANGFTNRRPETMDKQTVNRLHTIQQSKDIKSQMDTSKAYETASVRCIASNKLATVKSNGRKCFFRNLSASVQDYAQHWKEMNRLEYCIEQLYQVTLRMSKKFKIPDDTLVEIFPKGYMPYQKVPGSDTTAKKIIGTIAEHDGKSISIWYAEIICFLKLSLPKDRSSDQVRELEVAFVKWYKEIKKADRHELLDLPVLKVEKTQRKASPDATDTNIRYQMEPFTDLRLTAKLLRPVFLQKDLGTTTSTFVHNTYVN